jgi:hypothetical protein
MASRERSIGGPLGLAQYAALASMHRPTDPESIDREVRRLHGTGLSRRDIAAALRLDLDQVVNALAEVSR